MKLPEGKTRLDLIREGIAEGGIKKRGRLVVAIERLREDPRNERRTFRNMDGLIESVKAVGLIEPITVTPGEEEGQGGYQIVTGHRRFRAAKAAGLSQVEVLIRDPENALSRRVKSIISNIQREDVGAVEMAEALQALLDEDQRVKSQSDLATMIGKDKAWVSGMLRILSLPIDLRKKVGSTQLSLPYDAMIRIARLEKREDQEQLIDALLGGATQKQVRQRIDELKGKPTSSGPSKPKKVYHTKYKATVIVQALGTRLTQEQCMEALQDALGQAATS